MVDLLNLQSEREVDPSAAKALLDASKRLTRASLNVIEGAKVGWVGGRSGPALCAHEGAAMLASYPASTSIPISKQTAEWK